MTAAALGSVLSAFQAGSPAEDLADDLHLIAGSLGTPALWGGAARRGNGTVEAVSLCGGASSERG